MKNLTLFALLLAGCGASYSDSDLLADLDSEQAVDFCVDSLQSEEITADCDGLEITIGGDTEADCTGVFDVNEDCTATVQDAKDCNQATIADPCTLFSDSACLKVLECYATTE